MYVNVRGVLSSGPWVCLKPKWLCGSVAGIQTVDNAKCTSFKRQGRKNKLWENHNPVGITIWFIDEESEYPMIFTQL